MREYVYSADIHQRLQDVREALKMSARQMSRALGRSITYYSSLETKTDQYINEGAIIAICNAFSASYDYIVFGEGPILNEQDAGMKTIVRIYEDLPEMMQKCLVENARFLRYRADQEKRSSQT